MLVNLNEILKNAQKNNYAVGLFNTTDSDMLQAVIEAAEETNSPVIIGTAEVLLPYGELDLIAPSMIAAAKRAKVPVAVHYDHGLTFDRCMQALKLGFSSVMFDGSAGDYDTNIADTRQIVKIAHSFGATVEGEIGHVGQTENCDNDATDMYTTPEEAMSFLDATGVDALAIAIGTAHGVYKSKPKLDIERLKAIRAKTDTPLVLHGGSGLSDDDFRNAISGGIAKINIFTDLCVAGKEAVKASNADYLDMRNEKVEAIKNAVIRKMTLFGSVGKA
ncbi:MAG: class II fructose-bisphosphate aldolase [Ruminococcaceae bacterium]|nr:class II fructose-bisphosphate aldolase [Oscillospiraceae bacterium]